MLISEECPDKVSLLLYREIGINGTLELYSLLALQESNII